MTATAHMALTELTEHTEYTATTTAEEDLRRIMNRIRHMKTDMIRDMTPKDRIVFNAYK